jgi:N-formylmaleamate deformylase
MKPWQSDFVEANGLRHHYTRTGGDKPALVLAHGFSDNGQCWSVFAEEFENDFDVVMPDARGHGLSEAPEIGYGPPQQADDLAGIINALGLQHPIVLGHSMGAMTALTLAGRYPDLPRAIILEDPPPWWLLAQGENPYGEEWRAQTSSWLGTLRKMTRDELIAHGHKQDPQWAEVELGPWAEAKLQMKLNILNPQPAPDIDWAMLLTRITAPTLLITSEHEHGAILTPQLAETLKVGVPHAEVVQIKAAGHCIRRDQPERYAGVVMTFIDSLGK